VLRFEGSKELGFAEVRRGRWCGRGDAKREPVDVETFKAIRTDGDLDDIRD